MTVPDAASPPPGDLPMAWSSLPATAGETTRERPWPVRHLSPKIGDYIGKMAPVWVEGQLLNVKRWKHLVFVTLRDTDQNMSLRATVPAAQFDALGAGIARPALRELPLHDLPEEVLVDLGGEHAVVEVDRPDVLAADVLDV